MNITEAELSTRSLLCNVDNIILDPEKIFLNLPFRHRLRDYSYQVVFMYYKDERRGDNNYSNKKKKTSFRNAVNIVLLNEKNNDKYNVKLTKQGSFQISGAKNSHMVYESIQYLLELLLSTTSDFVEIIDKAKKKINVVFKTIMTNYVANLPFKVNKDNLNRLINKNTDYFNLYEETNWGYTGCNIKKKLNVEDYDLRIPRFSFNIESKTWEYDTVELFVNTTKKKMFNTFLVFHSGKIIISGMMEDTMNDDYVDFYKFLIENQKKIQDINVY